jgi:hypothetical protein
MRIRGLTERLSAAESTLSRQRAEARSSSYQSPQRPILYFEKRLATVSSNGPANMIESVPVPSVEEEESDPTNNSEITDINHYTKTIEFHGSSSSVAILRQVQGDCGKLQEQYSEQYSENKEEAASLISALHNPGFSPQPPPTSRACIPSVEHSYYIHQANVFMTSYFDTLHCIHPIIDKEDFSERAKDLWQGQSCSSSFMALYYSVLSLGALVRVWEEDELLGMTRFEWSRKLFQKAQVCLDESKFANNLDTIQCLFLMV